MTKLHLLITVMGGLGCFMPAYYFVLLTGMSSAISFKALIIPIICTLISIGYLIFANRLYGAADGWDWTLFFPLTNLIVTSLVLLLAYWAVSF